MSKEKEKEFLEIPEKKQDQFVYIEAVKYMVQQKKAEFEALQGKITQYKTQLSVLESRLLTLESEHNAKLLQDRQKFENEKQIKLNDLMNRTDALQRGEADLIHRKIIIEEQESEIEKTKQERKNLLDEKMKFEHFNTELEIKFKEANEKMEAAIILNDKASTKNLDADTKFKEANNQLSISQRIKDEYLEKEEDIKKQTENLITLREEIAPQIEELKSLIAKNEETISEISKKEQNMKDRIEEDNQLLAKIDERDRTVKTKELTIATREEELLRKELIFKNQ